MTRKQKMFLNSLVCCLFLLVFGSMVYGMVLTILYPSKPVLSEPIRVDHVERVMLHNGSNYSVFYREGNRVYRMRVCLPQNDAEIYLDVPKGEDAWMSYRRNETTGAMVEAQFHFPSMEILEGGGWHHPNGTSGRTGVLH